MDKFSKGCMSGCLLTGIALVFIAIMVAVFYEEKELTLEEKIEQQFSPADGRHYNLQFFIEDNINDPSSFEHVETRYSVKEDHILVQMTYRAKNMFNALVLNQVTAKVHLETGEVLEIVEEK